MSESKSVKTARLHVPRCQEEAKLGNELGRLKKTLGHELKVVWDPRPDYSLDGEVRGDTIYVYAENPDKAIKILRHEFLDYAISQLVEPYKKVTNALIALINEECYKRKERLVEKLSKLL